MQFRTPRLLAGALALLMMLSLAGCREKPGGAASSAGPEATSSGAAQTEPVETEPPEEAHLPILPLDDSQMADPAARVIDRTPLDGREGLTVPGRKDGPESLDYSLGPVYVDLYPNASPFDSFRELLFFFGEWDLDTFQVRLSGRSTLETEVRACTPEPAPQLDPAAQPDALPYYVYASWRGMDWKELARLELAAREDPDDGNAARARDAFRDRYLEDFLALQPEDLPTLPHLCEVLFRFPADSAGGEVIDEAITSIDMSWDTVSQGSVGWGSTAAINLRSEDPRPAESPGLTLAAPGYEVPAAPLNDGDCAGKAMEFTAEEDLTLHGFQLYRSRVELRQITLVRTLNGETAEEVWDGKSDLQIRAGETVALYLTLHDPDAESWVNVYWPDGVIHGNNPKAARPEDRVEWHSITLGEYRKDQFCVLRYRRGDEDCSAATELVLRHDANLWELIFFCACDGDHQFSEHLYSYYLDYYNPLCNPAWQGETPSPEAAP